MIDRTVDCRLSVGIRNGLCVCRHLFLRLNAPAHRILIAGDALVNFVKLAGDGIGRTQCCVGCCWGSQYEALAHCRLGDNLVFRQGDW